MNIRHFAWHGLALAASLATLPAAHATNGYFPHGFGLKAKGMGGASLALSHDGFAGVNNPAQSAWAGNRLDVGGEIFSPRRSATVATPMGPMEVESGKKQFLIPELGYNVGISNRLGVGITVYGNGGMNTEYPAVFPGDSNFFCSSPTTCGQGKLGVDLMQLIVAPTVAYKVSEQHAFGVSPLLVYQRFKAYGLQAFGLPNQGRDSSTGVGVRLGYLGQFGDRVSVGASFSPKIDMSRFKKYGGLFADNGDFDIPQNLAVGVAVKLTPAVQLALDWQRIKYSGVRSIGNASLPNFGNGFGASNGPGFGWQDVNVAKLGVQWQVNPAWTLRAGYNVGSNPVRSEDVYLNILAPGVVRQHLTMGATYAWSAKEELTVAAWHARRQNVDGSMPAPTRIGMSQTGFGLQYSRKF